jgi:superfamily II DNA helicase RecQ
MSKYLLNVLVSLSQVLNALLYGDPKMTLSARCFVQQDEFVFGILRRVIDALFWFDENHCYSSWRRDIEFCQQLGWGKK